VLCAAGSAAPQQFDPDAYLRYVRFLASDELKGRGNGTPELDKAAEYIAQQFRSAGLVPAGDNSTFFQKFTVTAGSELGPDNRLTLRSGTQAIDAAVRRDYVPIGMGDKSLLSGPVVFAGYGITAGEYNYDDYKGQDVTGKIVLVLAHEPRENDDASPFAGKQLTTHGQDNIKAINAKYRLARAILIVQDPANHPDAESALTGLSSDAQVEELGIAAFRISRSLADKILRTQDKGLLQLQRLIDERMAPQSFDLSGVEIQIEMDIKRVRKEERNVVGMLPGTEPKIGDEEIVIGAHYDHLGRGDRSSMDPQFIGQVHHGADDNASGTAGLIELAAALAKAPALRKRTYVFVAFAAEELGLNGSAYWVDHAGRPPDRIVAMLNMDMIGRSRNDQVLVSGVGTSPAFSRLVESAAAQAGLKTRPSSGGYGGSDQQSFYLKNIPVLFFFSDLHSDYHRPSDTWDKINVNGALKILDMVHGIATELNRMDPRPQFTRVNETVTPPAGAGGVSYGTYFGSVPDMTAEVDGVRFSDVRPNSPAAKAGLRGQDVLIRFAGKEVKNLQDFNYMLRTHKPGETIEVVVLRDGQPMTVQVTLGVRR
jgi:hypothetical protein